MSKYVDDKNKEIFVYQVYCNGMPEGKPKWSLSAAKGDITILRNQDEYDKKYYNMGKINNHYFIRIYKLKYMKDIEYKKHLKEK